MEMLRSIFGQASSKTKKQENFEYCSKIEVDPETHMPNKVWDKYKIKRKVINVEPMDLKTPVYDDKIRFVCLSDTHSKMDKMFATIPDGDVLIHAGDFTTIGLPADIEKFNELLGRLPHKYKVVIAGNHDQTFADNFNESKFHGPSILLQEMQNRELTTAKSLLTNCIYLQDSMVELYGIKIYGSPWQPEFYDWAFNVERGENLLKIWNQIPEETDILITHGPPLGYGDANFYWSRCGCVELLNTIQKRVKPKYHIFGHIHEGYGILSDGNTTYINASTCTLRYKPTNPPIIFDIPLPNGQSKKDVFMHENQNAVNSEQDRCAEGACHDDQISRVFPKMDI